MDLKLLVEHHSSQRDNKQNTENPCKLYVYEGFFFTLNSIVVFIWCFASISH